MKRLFFIIMTLVVGILCAAAQDTKNRVIVDVPQGVWIDTYQYHTHFNFPLAQFIPPGYPDYGDEWDWTMNWNNGSGGKFVGEEIYDDGRYPNYHTETDWAASKWPQSPPAGVEIYWGDGGSTGTNSADPPSLIMEHCDADYTSYAYSNVVNQYQHRTADTSVVLGTGTGTRQSLWVINVGATALSLADPDYAQPIDPSQITINGHSVDGDGNVYLVLPDGQTLPITVDVIYGSKYYAFGITATKYTLTHQTTHTALTDTNLSRLNLGVGEEVIFSGLPNDTNTTWTVSGGGLSAMSGCPVTFTAASNACTATVTAIVHGQSLPAVKFNVVEPTFHGTSIITGYISLPDGQIGAGMINQIDFLPTNVSFYRVFTWELPVGIANITGYFADHPSLIPTNVTIGSAQLPSDPSQVFSDNVKTVLNSYVIPLYEGSWDYLVTNLWTIPGSNITNFWGVATERNTLINSDGDFSVNKWGQTATRSFNDGTYH